MKKQNLFFLPLLLATQLSFAGSFSDEARVVSADPCIAIISFVSLIKTVTLKKFMKARVMALQPMK